MGEDSTIPPIVQSSPLPTEELCHLWGERRSILVFVFGGCLANFRWTSCKLVSMRVASSSGLSAAVRSSAVPNAPQCEEMRLWHTNGFLQFQNDCFYCAAKPAQQRGAQYPDAGQGRPQLQGT